MGKAKNVDDCPRVLAIRPHIGNSPPLHSPPLQNIEEYSIPNAARTVSPKMKLSIVALLFAAATTIAVPGDDDDLIFPIEDLPATTWPLTRHHAKDWKQVSSSKKLGYEADDERRTGWSEDQQFSSHNKVGYEAGDMEKSGTGWNEDQQFYSHNKVGYEAGDMEKSGAGWNEDQQFSSHNKVGYETFDKRGMAFNEDKQFYSHNKVGYEGEGGRKRGLSRGDGGKVTPW
ncbi:hypothetical protein QBC34DRAFT_379165 [Podospora aff. communis PSN243]|uniref:Uncharacterized protein n=1 Tax=Podospora aff. communis PSN243 TaxID=3040156 RepID=A0AAV9GS21_9PEZI|nr:hypothetical protein QBC34DRAFT_379165 [Podospora aff. communis PSN243]